MSSTLKLTVLAELDGVPVAGFPVVRRLAFDEVQAFNVERASGGGYATLPLSELTTVQALVLLTDTQVDVRFAGQSDAGVTVAPGGLVILFDINTTNGAQDAAKVNNSGGAVAILSGVGAGT